MYDYHVNGLRGCYLTFAPVCVWLTTGNMHLKILLCYQDISIKSRCMTLMLMSSEDVISLFSY